MKRSLESRDLESPLYFRTTRFKDLRLRRGRGLGLKIQVEVKIEPVNKQEDSFWIELSIWNQRVRSNGKTGMDDLLCFRLDDAVNFCALPNAKIGLGVLLRRVLVDDTAAEALATVMTGCIAKFGKLEIELDHSLGEEAIDRDKVSFCVTAGGFVGTKTLTWKEVKHVFEQVRH
jgi:hypothetical protein